MNNKIVYSICGIMCINCYRLYYNNLNYIDEINKLKKDNSDSKQTQISLMYELQKTQYLLKTKGLSSDELIELEIQNKKEEQINERRVKMGMQAFTN